MKEKKELNIQIGRRIQDARQSTEMTQAQFAELLGVSDQYVSDLERGVVGTSIPTLVKICSILNVSSDSLLFGTVETPPGGIFKNLDKLPVKQYLLIESAVNLMLEAFSVNAADIPEGRQDESC